MSEYLSGIRAVFFDAVGTLLFPNPRAVYVYAEAAARRGLSVTPDAIGPRLWQRLREEDDRDRELVWATSEDRERERWRSVVNAALPGATANLFEELFQHFSLPTAWAVPPDAADALARLNAAGFTLGMGSNYDSRLRSVVDGTPTLAPVRQRLVISSLVGTRKPGRAFFDAVIESARCSSSEILFVGDDRENDFAGATAAGLRAVLLDPQGKQPDVSHRVRSLAELLPP
jgi:putative hydrolase of the HAD superfamily